MNKIPSLNKRAIIQDGNTARLIELDWLRVLAFGLLIFYHIGMLYTQGWGWHYKSAYSSEFLANIMLWSNQWRMSLLFLISGAAVSFMLAKQSPWLFIRQRFIVLSLPIIFGMLVVVVPQVYVEANSTGKIIEHNYWRFWYIYLDQSSVEFTPYKTIGAMHLTWNHLWFLPYILVYSLIVACIYPLFIRPCVVSFGGYLNGCISVGWVVAVPTLIFTLNSWLLYDRYPQTHNLIEDWFNHGRYFLVFFLGFLGVRTPSLWLQLARFRWSFLLPAILTYSYTLFVFHGGDLGDGWLMSEVNRLCGSANSWLWVLTVVAWAQHFFRATNLYLRYLNAGIFCFYILHQTLIIVFAYWLAPLKLGPLLEPILLIVLVFSSCVLLYEFIKRIPFLHLVFGVKPPKAERV